jgi:hypothetical protein
MLLHLTVIEGNLTTTLGKPASPAKRAGFSGTGCENFVEVLEMLHIRNFQQRTLCQRNFSHPCTSRNASHKKRLKAQRSQAFLSVLCC